MTSLDSLWSPQDQAKIDELRKKLRDLMDQFKAQAAQQGYLLK